MKRLKLNSRFFAPAFEFVFLAMLAMGVVMVPRSIAAQESAPASQPASAANAPAAEASGAAKPEAAKTQEDENDQFRHTPLVESAGKALHLSMETTARLFEFINFAIIALALGIPLFRILPKFIRKRAEKVRNDIESARKVTEDANARLSAVEAKLSKLDEEIAQIRLQVEEESRQDEARIKAALEEESARIVIAAEQEIGSAAAQARRGLRHFAADLAIEQAVKQMVLTPETDRALIAEFIGSGTRGGQN